MTYRMMNPTWSAAILLVLSSVAQGQITPPFFGNPAAMHSPPPAANSQGWSNGTVDRLPFISTEPTSPSPPQDPSSQPQVEQPTDQQSTSSSDISDSPTQPGWPPEKTESEQTLAGPGQAAAITGGAPAGGAPAGGARASSALTGGPFTRASFGGGSFGGGAFDSGAFDSGAFDGGAFDGGALTGGARTGSAPTAVSNTGSALSGGIFSGGSLGGGSFTGGSFTGSGIRGGELNSGAIPGGTLHGDGLVGDVAHGSYGPGPSRMFVQLDLLTWGVTRPDITPIGDRGSEGMVNVGGVTYFRGNSLDTGFITSNWSLGGRVDFGRIEDRRGWSGSVLFYNHRDQVNADGVWFMPNDPDGLLLGYQDSNNDTFDDDVNLNQIYGRSGQDLGTPDPVNPGLFIAPFDGTPDQPAAIDTGDLVGWLVTFNTLSATNSVHLTGVELMDVYRPTGWGATTVDLFCGMRYLEFREEFSVVASGGILDSSRWNVNSDNDILGPQIGARWAANREWFRFTAEGRFLAGINFQNNRLSGNIASNASPGGVNQPIALEAFSFNSLHTNADFAPVGEWRLETSYYANSWLAFRLGYTGMAIGGVSRASSKVAYTLPTLGLTSASSNDTVLVNGLNVGVEINR